MGSLRAKWSRHVKTGGGDAAETRELTDEEVVYADWLEKFLCRATNQGSAYGDERKQRAVSPSTVKRYHVTPAIDSPEPAPHNWQEFRHNNPKVQELLSDPVVQAFEAKVKAWKDRRKQAKVAADLEKTREYVEQETSFLDNSPLDDRIQYSELRGWKRHDYTEQEIWDTVTRYVRPSLALPLPLPCRFTTDRLLLLLVVEFESRHGQTPTCEEVIELQGTTHVQMYTLGMDEVVDYRETVRPIEQELNLHGVFNNYCPEHSQVIFHGRERNFSNHDPVLFELEALGRLKWPGELSEKQADLQEEEEGEEERGAGAGGAMAAAFAQATATKGKRAGGAKGRGRGRSKKAAADKGDSALVVEESLDEDTAEDGVDGLVSSNMDRINLDASGNAADPFASQRRDSEEVAQGAFDDDTLYVSDDATDNEDNMNYDTQASIWSATEDEEGF